jgi:hypothetical protein
VLDFCGQLPHEILKADWRNAMTSYPSLVHDGKRDHKLGAFRLQIPGGYGAVVKFRDSAHQSQAESK